MASDMQEGPEATVDPESAVHEQYFERQLPAKAAKKILLDQSRFGLCRHILTKDDVDPQTAVIRSSKLHLRPHGVCQRLHDREAKASPSRLWVAGRI